MEMAAIAQDAARTAEAGLLSEAHFTNGEKELAATAETAEARGASSQRFRELQFAGGLILLALVVVLWVGSSVLTQFLYTDVDYAKPVALTTLCTATASVFCCSRLAHWCSTGCSRELRGGMNSVDADSVPFWVAFLISANWFLCQATFNISLQHTAIATNTLLSCSSVVWTYVFGLIVGMARFSVPGALCVVCAMTGVGLAVAGTMSTKNIDPNAPKDSLGGEAVALASAMSYGVFSLALKKLVQPNQMSYLWGAVGVYSLLIGMTLMLICHFIGFETAEMPSMKALGMMLLNGVLGTSLSDYLWAQAVLLTSPLVATVCLNLTIPLGMIVDTIVLKEHTFSWTSPAGASLIFLGVIAAALDERRSASVEAM
jgi:solute carrier family 35 protein F5